MASSVDICNDALIQVGAENLILSLDEESNEARICKALYDTCRQQVLTRYDWNSARRQARLTPLLEKPIYSYGYSFQLPADCLRVVRFSDSDSQSSVYRPTNPWSSVNYATRWAVFADKLYSDASVALIEYISDFEDVGKMSADLRDAITAYLAAKIAYNLTGSRAKENDMKQWFMSIIDEAMATNSLAKSSEQYTSDAFLVVR